MQNYKLIRYPTYLQRGRINYFTFPKWGKGDRRRVPENVLARFRGSGECGG